MKKLLIVSLVLVSFTGLAYAAKDSVGCGGDNKFVQNLQLEHDRADQVQEILRSYSGIKDLFMDGRQDEIPEFLAQKEAELAAVLTPEELAQFKNDVAAWAESKDFSRFKHFSSMGGWTHKDLE